MLESTGYGILFFCGFVSVGFKTLLKHGANSDGFNTRRNNFTSFLI